MSAVLALSRYTPTIITLFLYIVGIRYKEIYLLFFGIGLTLDGFLSLLINRWSVEPPRIEGCLPIFGSVLAYPPQHAAFFTAFSLGFVALYRPRIKIWHILLVTLFFVFVVIGSDFLNYYTPDAIVSGVLVGVAGAYVYQILLHWLLVPYICTILEWRLVRYLAYQDTLCTGEHTPNHVLVAEAFDRVFATQRMISKEEARTFIASQTF